MKALLDRLEIEARLINALLVATEEERLALASGGIDRILQCTERKRSILEAYESLGISRDHLLERLPGGRDVLEGRATIADLAAAAPDGLRDAILEVVARIQQMGRRLQRLNGVNGLLLQRTLDWTVRARSALVGESAAEPVYTRRGHYRAAPAMRAAVVQERA